MIVAGRPPRVGGYRSGPSHPPGANLLSKRFGKSSLLEYAVGGVSRLYVRIDRELYSGLGIPPDLVISISLPEEFTTTFLQSFFHGAGISRHQATRTRSSRCAMTLNGTS